MKKKINKREETELVCVAGISTSIFVLAAETKSNRETFKHCNKPVLSTQKKVDKKKIIMEESKPEKKGGKMTSVTNEPIRAVINVLEGCSEEKCLRSGVL